MVIVVMQIVALVVFALLLRGSRPEPILQEKINRRDGPSRRLGP